MVFLGRVQPDGAHPSPDCKLTTAEGEPYSDREFGHEHMALDSRKFFCPGR